MEIILPPPSEFTADSACTSPYGTPVSRLSPRRGEYPGNFNFFYSAPTSPARVSALFDNSGDAEESLDDEEFAFAFSGRIETDSLTTADELFDGGKIKIKPLKPPPRYHFDQNISPSPKSPVRAFREAFSPRARKNKDFDPFAAALERTREVEPVRNSRGRERSKRTTGDSSKTNSRSLSPFRVSDLLFHDPEPEPKSKSSLISKSSFPASIASFFNKKWKIKDLLLFRSASESRAKNDDDMKKHKILRNARLDGVKTSSFHSTCSSGSVSPSSTSGRRKSAHEHHYTVNRAASEELKKRTSLPYRPTLLACVGSNPSLHQLSGFSPNSSVHGRD